jgi:glycosyltransferase involved in cell wall biosynthesis
MGIVANLNPEKGIEYFVQAAGFVLRQLPEARFLVVGASYATHRDYSAQIDGEVHRSGAPRSQFHFVGERANVEDYFAAMDVALLTSIREAAPTTVMEALSCGVPVIASAVGSVPSMVRDGVSGYVAPPRRPDAFAEAALRVLQDRDLRAQLGDAARRDAVQRFGTDATAEAHLAAFDAAMASGRPVPCEV